MCDVRLPGSDAADAYFKVNERAKKQKATNILEAIDEQERQPQTRRPIRLAIDKGPTVYRRRIASLVEAGLVNT